MPIAEAHKYVQVQRAIIQDIELGHLAAGSLIPSEAELLQRFDVSRPTLVRALRELVRDGWVHRKQGIGTFVVDRARRSAEAALQDTRGVPLFVHDSAMKQRGDAKEVLIHLIRGIQNGLEATGQDMVLRSVPDGHSAELEEFISSRLPGPALVVEPSSAPNLWKDLRDRGWNTWAILDHIEDGNCVYIDQEHAGYLAARFLLNKGCRKIALLNGPLTRYWGFKARLAGYKRALTEFKVPFKSALVMEGEHVVDSESGRSMLRSLIEADEAFDGVVGVSDGKTIGAMMAAEEAGLKVGEDVQFVSIDNTVAEFAPHPLSSVVLAFEEAGRLAASLATSNLFTAGPTPILTQCKLTPTVVER